MPLTDWSYRRLSEMLEERHVPVDHLTLDRGAIRSLPLIEKMAHKCERPVNISLYIVETYIRVKAVFKHLHRAVGTMARPSTFC